MTIFFIIFFICSIAFSVMINTLFLRFAQTLGIRDQKETIIRWASTSKPALGGISFFIVFLISLACYSMFFEAKEVLMNKKVVGLLGTTTIAFMMGLADDAYDTKPILKLFAQVICGLILCYSGIHIEIFQEMFLNYIVTILWVVGIMNSLNMLDNMDAIAAIVGLMIFATAGILILTLDNTSNIHFLLLIGQIGALSGFLVYNWHPSKLYMGDTGSQVMGLLLAAMGIIYFWNAPADTTAIQYPTKQILIVLTAYILPITDTTIVVINRIRDGRSPFVGGRDHTTHNLFYRGLTEKRIALLFGLISLSSLILVCILNLVITEWNIETFSLFSIYPITVFFFLFTITRIKKNMIRKTYSKDPLKGLVQDAEKNLS